MSIEVNGRVVEAGRMGVTVTAASVDARLCTVTGAGLSQATAGVVQKLALRTVDRFSNPVRPTGRTVELTMRDAAGAATVRRPGPCRNPPHAAPIAAGLPVVKGESAEQGDGYALTYLATQSGAFQMDLLLDASPVGGSPFTVRPPRIAFGMSRCIACARTVQRFGLLLGEC